MHMCAGGSVPQAASCRQHAHLRTGATSTPHSADRQPRSLADKSIMAAAALAPARPPCSRTHLGNAMRPLSPAAAAPRQHRSSGAHGARIVASAKAAEDGWWTKESQHWTFIHSDKVRNRNMSVSRQSGVGRCLTKNATTARLCLLATTPQAAPICCFVGAPGCRLTQQLLDAISTRATASSASCANRSPWLS